MLEAQGKLGEAEAALAEFWPSADAWPKPTRATRAGSAIWRLRQPGGRRARSTGQARRGPGRLGRESGDQPTPGRADPSNAAWQRDLAVAHSRVGGVLQAQGKLGEAQAAFGEYLAISRRLAEADPSNAGWQRELAVAHGRVGGVLKA